MSATTGVPGASTNASTTIATRFAAAQASGATAATLDGYLRDAALARRACRSRRRGHPYRGHRLVPRFAALHPHVGERADPLRRGERVGRVLRDDAAARRHAGNEDGLRPDGPCARRAAVR